MRRLQCGYILLPVLLLIQVLAIMGMHALFTQVHIRKVAQARWYDFESEQNALAILHCLENKFLFEQKQCEIKYTNETEMKSKSIAWWKSQACSGIFSTLRYYYVFEKLGTDRCCVQKSNSNEALTATFLRITLFVPGTQSIMKMVLQSTLFLPDGAGDMNCQKPLRLIKLGRQRYVRL